MKTNIFLIIFILAIVLSPAVLVRPLAAEKIVLKDNRVLYGKIERRTGDVIWVNIGTGSVGQNINDISFVYNDDGTTSEYSPKSKEEIVRELEGRLVDELSKTRGLPLKNKIESDELTSEEIKDFYFKRINETLPKEYIASEEKVLKMLKLVPADFTYCETLERFARQDIGGFYDYIDKKLYISKSIPPKIRNFVITHEVVHALQDENFNLQKFIPKELGNSDLIMARRSLVEGDATITGYDYLFRLAGEDIKSMPDVSAFCREAIEISFKKNEAFSRYSPFLQEQIIFTYLQGGSFVHKVLQNYSYEKLNDIYKDPPESTEHILHIEKYLFQKDKPVYITFDISEALPSGWNRIYSNRWGEYAIYSLLKQYIEQLFAKTASEGWGGDHIIAYENAELNRILLTWATSWDTKQDAKEFYNAYISTVDKRYINPKKVEKLATADETSFDCGTEGIVYVGVKNKEVLIIEGLQPGDVDKIIPAAWSYIALPKGSCDSVDS